MDVETRSLGLCASACRSRLDVAPVFCVGLLQEMSLGTHLCRHH